MSGYLGNTEDMIVHHLALMKPECNIYNIKKEARQYFTPDTFETAKKLGFSPCPHCN